MSEDEVPKVQSAVVRFRNTAVVKRDSEGGLRNLIAEDISAGFKEAGFAFGLADVSERTGVTFVPVYSLENWSHGAFEEKLHRAYYKLAKIGSVPCPAGHPEDQLVVMAFFRSITGADENMVTVLNKYFHRERIYEGLELE